MFGNKKSFNEGMKSGIRLSEEIVKRDTRAINKLYEILKNITGDTRELKETFKEVIKSLENSEIEKLFGIVKTSNPNDLEEEEKIILLQILVDIFKLPDSNFIDVKKEDFRFEFGDINFMVEIKGINTNVKNNNIAQCKKFVTDLIAEDDTMSPDSVKGLLIINPQRDIEPSKREPIHANQISYAKSEGILIITTLELLKLYQAYTKDEVVSNKCFETFKNNVGEFKFEEEAK